MKEKKLQYQSTLMKNKEKPQQRLLIGVPLTGLVRAEWMLARYGQITPCNWSQGQVVIWLNQFSPLGFLVADARNAVATDCVEQNYEWLLFIDHDTILPPDAFVKINERMIAKDVPIYSGLYFTKSKPAEPLVYRGSGTGYYNKWKMGDKVWVDGVPMGCTLIHSSILKVLYDSSESYLVGQKRCRKIFETPSKVRFDPETNAWLSTSGTEDLFFCNRVIKEKVMEKAGWKKYAKKKYPFQIDTSLFCRHIDFDGNQFPSMGEELQFN